MAPKKKAKEDKRTETIVVKVTEAERELADEIAKQQNTTVSDLVRTCLYTHKGHL